MKHFKQLTSFRYKQANGIERWQKSYFDHVVRKDEDLARQAFYIADNPVRKGLVEDWRDYPLTGGSLLVHTDGDLKVAATCPAPAPEARGGPSPAHTDGDLKVAATSRLRRLRPEAVRVQQLTRMAT